MISAVDNEEEGGDNGIEGMEAGTLALKSHGASGRGVGRMARHMGHVSS